MGWNRRATSMFSQLRTWKEKIKKSASGQCECGEGQETVDHVMFNCKRWADYRKGWRSWENIDTRWKQWLMPRTDSEGKVE